MNKFSAFDEIKASEKLKSKTAAFLTEEIYRRNNRDSGKIVHILPKAATAVFAIALLVFGLWLWSNPFSMISIDMNPSLELGINIFGKIVSARAYNDDGAKIANTVNVLGLEYSDAVEVVLASDAFDNYIHNDSVVIFTVISENDDKIISNIKSTEAYETVDASCEKGNSSDVALAHENGLSFGKYQAYLNIREVMPEITIEEIKNMTMREIRDLSENVSEESKITDNNGKHEPGGSSAVTESSADEASVGNRQRKQNKYGK